jgi:Uma2 family endonuclease
VRVAADAKLTYADYMTSPEDHHRWEVIDGRWARTPFPGTNHQLVVGELIGRIHNYIDTHWRGGFCFTYLAVILGPHDIYEPDIMVLTEEQIAAIHGDEHPSCVPPLCMEIIEDETRVQDRGIKKERYAAFGVSEYWIIDWQEETVEVYVLEGGSYTKLCAARGTDSIPSQNLPGLELQPAILFEDLHIWLRYQDPASDVP